MKRRIILLVALVTFILSLQVFALENRATYVRPTLSFGDDEAECRVLIIANASDDEIVAYIKLYENNRCIETWVEEATGYLNFVDTVPVVSGKTYELTVNADIDGVEHPSVSVEKTYR